METHKKLRTFSLAINGLVSMTTSLSAPGDNSIEDSTYEKVVHELRAPALEFRFEKKPTDGMRTRSGVTSWHPKDQQDMASLEGFIERFRLGQCVKRDFTSLVEVRPVGSSKTKISLISKDVGLVNLRQFIQAMERHERQSDIKALVIQIVTTVVEKVKEFRDAKVVHGDISPPNIMVYSKPSGISVELLVSGERTDVIQLHKLLETYGFESVPNQSLDELMSWLAEQKKQYPVSGKVTMKAIDYLMMKNDGHKGELH